MSAKNVVSDDSGNCVIYGKGAGKENILTAIGKTIDEHHWVKIAVLAHNPVNGNTDIQYITHLEPTSPNGELSENQEGDTFTSIRNHAVRSSADELYKVVSESIFNQERMIEMTQKATKA